MTGTDVPSILFDLHNAANIRAQTMNQLCRDAALRLVDEPTMAIRHIKRNRRTLT